MPPPVIRIATTEDIPDIMRFWDEHWVPGHVMSRDRGLVSWQHVQSSTGLSQDGQPGRVNFVLAERQSNDLTGFLGFVPMSRFDPAILPAEDVIFLAGWRMRADAPPGLGAALLARLRASLRPPAIITLGLNERVRALYERFGFRTDTLRHHVLPNPDIETLRLADIPGRSHWPASTGGAVLRRLDRNALMALPPDLWQEDEVLPKKTPGWLAARYLDHPHYQYALFLLVGATGPKGILVLRRCMADGASALRLVDCVGSADMLCTAGTALIALLRANDAEYMDLFAEGMDATALAAAGFHAVAHLSGAVVPNHFEPFVRENRPIRFASLTPPGRRLRLFKGDGDQDRPNLVPVLPLPIRECESS
ncbi:hypothetical protein [Azospirillum palustre]